MNRCYTTFDYIFLTQNFLFNFNIGFDIAFQSMMMGFKMIDDFMIGNRQHRNKYRVKHSEQKKIAQKKKPNTKTKKKSEKNKRKLLKRNKRRAEKMH